MSSASVNAHADAGLRAVAKGAYADGIKLLTQALDTHNAPSWLMERSKAYVRVDRYADALDDAEKALHIALDRGNRDLMADAQLRRAIALYRMQKFADADVCAFWAYRLTEGAKARQDDGQRNMVDENGDYIPRLQEVKAEAEKKYAPKVGKDGLLESIGRTERSKIESQRNQALTWRIQALTAMDKLPLGHDGRKIHLTEMYPSSSNLPTSNDTAQDAADEAVDPWEQVWTQYETEWHKHKIRHSFYQTDTGLTIDIFVKNLSPEQAVIESYPDAIKIIPAQGAAFGPPGGPIVIFLADRIDPQATKYTVKSMKIEVILKKETPRKWSGLRCRHADIVDNLTIANRAPHPTDFSQCIKALG
ncbi:hypothetical protein F5Y08DRAFT_317974 [Xylaria arbuscula]|nr:hypothetical protein F5Y08DRAFT_317974 [Xylaria arbuscula]